MGMTWNLWPPQKALVEKLKARPPRTLIIPSQPSPFGHFASVIGAGLQIPPFKEGLPKDPGRE